MTMASGQANAEITDDGTSPTLTCLHEMPIVIDRAAFNQGKNAAYPPPHRKNRGDGPADREGSARRFVCCSNGGDVVGALCARDYKGIGNEYVSEGKVICEVVTLAASHVSWDSRDMDDREKTYMLKLRHTGTPNVGGGGEGSMIGEGVSYTLATSQDQTMFVESGDTYVVRRLTPTECERLMGFPDGHTDIPYRGKEHPPDTPRYKALGNSMATNCMRWIGERIQMVQEVIDETDDGSGPRGDGGMA